MTFTKKQMAIFHRARVRKDPYYDGKFFIAVKTTGIYCRPICPAKANKENVEFFITAIEAVHAGYRACLRCRPESIPQSPAWLGTGAVIGRAIKLISKNELQDLDENKFANKFGISARHLRRLFKQKVGKTPKQISNAQRLTQAKKLILETQMPMTEIAFLAGFQSVRRFNDAIKKQFDCSPRALRKQKEKSL